METSDIYRLLVMFEVGKLTAEVLIQPLGVGGTAPTGASAATPLSPPWKVLLSLQNGKVSHCERRDTTDQLLSSGVEALTTLIEQGRYSYQILSGNVGSFHFTPVDRDTSTAGGGGSSTVLFRETTGEITTDLSLSAELVLRPVRTSEGDEMIQSPAAISREGWQVLIRCNGRTVGEIVQSLDDGSPAHQERVVRLVRSLKQHRLIVTKE